MHLTRLSVERYKCFAQREDIEIRPLTLLIGRNSSGKSVLARLPLLLRHALSGQGVAPLDLEVDGVSFGGSFLDLVHGRFRHGSVALGFRVEEHGRAWDWHVEVQNIDEKKLQILKRLNVVEENDDEIHFEWTEAGDPSRPHYRVRHEGKDPYGFTGGVEFNGIVPKTLPGPGSAARAFFFVAQHFAEDVFKDLRYLGPFRKAPSREHGYPGGRLRDVGPMGIRAAEALGGEAARRERAVLDAVGQFYETHLGGWWLDVEDRGDRFSLVLRTPGERNTIVNLVDAGVGLSQVLPLVVQRHLDRDSVGGDGIEIIEQPELHLHPAAHAALADLYVDAVKPRPCPRFIIETHSENFILRIRRRIAEQQISADDVALYWIDDSSGEGSRVRPIDIDPNGDVKDWPRGVFSEDFEEVKAMRRAQQQRRAP